MLSLQLYYGLPLHPSRENVHLLDFNRNKSGSETPLLPCYLQMLKIYVGWLSSEFSRAMMSASTGSEGLSATAVGGGGEAAASLSSLATAIAERQQTGTTSAPG